MKWIKANESKPKEGWHNAKYGGDECCIDVNNGRIIITFPNGKIEIYPILNILEYLDETDTREQDIRDAWEAANRRFFAEEYGRLPNPHPYLEQYLKQVLNK